MCHNNVLMLLMFCVRNKYGLEIDHIQPKTSVLLLHNYYTQSPIEE